MKEGWERMEPPAVLGLRQLAEIIKPAFPGKKLLAAERIGVGLSNANYKIFLDGSTAPYVLRLYRGNAAIAGKETAIVQRIRHLVPVADFFYMDWSGSTFGKPWAILEWKEGILLRDVFRSGNGSGIASAAASAGRTLAKIHSFAFSESGFFDQDLKIADPLRMGGSRLLSFIESCLFDGACGEWLGKDMAHEVGSSAGNTAHY
ncbi:phosphotransferase family protein [Paenibacillus sp. TAB 01]|uniref:phosphotransferase family protein n=1 Tax=Paenibacillus sp. TAB 01 TaxID=3368988 RepID=UPI003752DDB2